MPVTVAGTTFLSFVDSAFPLAHPPATDGTAVYIGGNATHVWTPADIRAVRTRYVLPIFVRSNMPGPGAAADVEAAVAYLKRIGCPPGKLVDWDTETQVDAAYIGEVSFLLGHAGYRLIDYGSRAFVSGNKNPDGWYWDADWTGRPHMDPEGQITQYESTQAYDLSLARVTLGPVLWEVHPPAGSWTYGAPGQLTAYTISRTGWRVRWTAVTPPAGKSAPPSYTVATYDSAGHEVNSQVTNALWATEYGRGGHGLPAGKYQTHVWANGAPAGPPHASVIVTIEGK